MCSCAGCTLLSSKSIFHIVYNMNRFPQSWEATPALPHTVTQRSSYCRRPMSVVAEEVADAN